MAKKTAVSRPPRPAPLVVQPDLIPEELKRLDQWVIWWYTWNGKKWDKPPKQAATLESASSTDPLTWTSYQFAFRMYQLPRTDPIDGIGMVVTEENGLVGLDFDHCRNPNTGEIAEWATKILVQLDSYTEVSPSSTGLRSWVRATLPPSGRKKGDIEMYNAGRYLTVTGWHVEWTPRTIESRQAELDALHKEVFAVELSSPPIRPNIPSVNGDGPHLTDDKLLEKALGARDGHKFARLWAGDTSAYARDGNSGKSEADLALCDLLAFWTTDESQIDRLFRRSGLSREKWDEARGAQTYGQRTIATALARVTDHWTPTLKQTTPEKPLNDEPTPPSTGRVVDNVSRDNTERPHLTDRGNAIRLARRYGADLRYSRAWSKWLTWTGQYWELDGLDTVETYAKHVIDELYGVAERLVRRLRDESAASVSVSLTDPIQTERKAEAAKAQAVLAWALKSEAAPRIHAMIDLARSEPGIPILTKHLDTHPWLLNCKNGIVDPGTAALMPHQRQYLFTKITPIEYDVDAKCPIWDGFLWRVMGGPASNAEGSEEALLEQHERATRLIAFLQRIIGYALTGDTSEQCLFLFHGPGRNGKSTFLETILALLGDYAKTAEFSTFLEHQHDTNVRNDIADLRGARFVATTEAPEGKLLAEVLMKRLTGQDTIKARFLYQEHFEFKPEFKLFLGANHKPVIRGTDSAIWRRIRLVPFDVTIPREEQDKSLPSKLRAELPGILAWAVQGCLAWKKHGLGEPDEVLKATTDYQTDMDIVGSFLQDYCIKGPVYKVSSSQLYAAYRAWAEASGEHALTQRTLGMRLIERGLTSRKGTAGICLWEGIGLIDPPRSDRET